jgi:hypothetical protein
MAEPRTSFSGDAGPVRLGIAVTKLHEDETQR